VYVDATCKSNADFIGVSCSEASDNTQRILGSAVLLVVVMWAISKFRKGTNEQAANRVGATRLPSDDKPKPTPNTSSRSSGGSSGLQAMNDKDLEWGNENDLDDDEWDAFGTADGLPSSPKAKRSLEMVDLPKQNNIASLTTPAAGAPALTSSASASASSTPTSSKKIKINLKGKTSSKTEGSKNQKKNRGRAGSGGKKKRRGSSGKKKLTLGKRTPPASPQTGPMDKKASVLVPEAPPDIFDVSHR
jgi:hypothetical protein